MWAEERSDSRYTRIAISLIARRYGESKLYSSSSCYLMDFTYRDCFGSGYVTAGATLMFEMPDAGENHREIVLIRRGNHFLVTDRSARLNDGGDAMLCRFINSVAEREERVRCQD